VHGPAALVIAHPGHELLLHHWLERARPRVFVLTDGSGREALPRLDVSARLLARTGATPGALFGPLPDRALYAAVLAGDHERLFALVDGLAGALVADGVATVVGDAPEGITLAHDLCHALTGMALALAARRGAPVAARYELPLYDGGTEPPRAGALRVTLDRDAFARKLAAARAYGPLAHEIDLRVAAVGLDAFRRETLRPAPVRPDPPARPPVWECWGESLVAAGRYGEAIRHRTHVAPLVTRLWRRVAEG
jgi:hypothetical protein